jgi:hypothetical protein
MDQHEEATQGFLALSAHAGLRACDNTRMQDPIRSLNQAVRRLEKWQKESRIVCAALLLSEGPIGIAMFVKGELLPDISASRIGVRGWGCAALSLIGGTFSDIDDSTKASVDFLHGGAAIDWSEAIAVTFPGMAGPTLLVIWANRT